MERRSTKHGPRTDDQLAHETEPMQQGTPQQPHAEEWRAPEPAEDVPTAGRPEVSGAVGSPSDDVALRSELARILTRDAFPAGRDDLLARLTGADASVALTERVAQQLPRRRFTDTHDVLAALGINAPEQRQP